MRCGEGIKLFTSSVMWVVWAQEEYLTHHTRREFDFDRLLYIIFFIKQIHRVRFVSVNGEASRGIEFFQIFFFFRIRIMTSIRISQWNLIPTKDVAPQSFCQNQNPVQDQDQDQDHDFTLDFNTRPTFHT